MKIHRKIYEQYNGPIPHEDNGRSYEIHHLDGNPDNNSPDNLVALTLREHYEIHKSQGDWGAAWLLSKKLKLSPEELSDIAKKSVRKQLAENNHPFQSGELQRQTQLKMVKNGTHNFAGGANARKRVADGTHHLLSGEIQRKAMRKRVADGTHNFSKDFVKHMLEQGKHPSQIKKQCEHCGKSCSVTMYSRWHGDKCKLR
jgi:HNH endonuclease